MTCDWWCGRCAQKNIERHRNTWCAECHLVVVEELHQRCDIPAIGMGQDTYAGAFHYVGEGRMHGRCVYVTGSYFGGSHDND